MSQNHSEMVNDSYPVAIWIVDVSGHLIKCPDHKREAIWNLSGSPAQTASFQKN